MSAERGLSGPWLLILAIALLAFCVFVIGAVASLLPDVLG